MNIQVTFQNCEGSPVMEKHINEQLAKIVHFLENERTPIWIDIIIKPGRTHAHHQVEFLLKTPHYDLVTHDEGPKIYQILDNVIDAMYAQLRKKKDLRVEDRKMVGRHDEFKKQR
jgi:ribosomal subunit interface protein